MDRSAIAKLLVSEGQRLFDAHATFVEFSRNPAADRLLNDLDNHPHAFVLACVMDRQMKAERAWLIPYLISEQLGDFKIQTLGELSLEEVTRLMTTPEPLHRFPEEMSKNFHSAVQTIIDVYGGNAAQIWSGKPSSADVVYRFLQFRGVGPKIATMTANTLARDFKIPFSDYYSIDVSVDVHVRRVFNRLGLTQVNDDVDSIVYLARALHPKFPGLLDLPMWEIGRNCCRPREMLCDQCIMKTVCPTANNDDA